jgi:alkylation response protein AidB-like acyl-CoA dehydrogenase
MGGVGFSKDYPIEKYYRDCKIGMNYNTIDTALVGLVD